MLLRAVSAVAMLFILPNAVAKEPKPLFADDQVIKLKISAPIDKIARKARTSTDPYDATLTLLGEDQEIREILLSARGNSRRRPEVCSFPPLRIEFKQKPEDESFFDGQKRLKLVTHCKRSPRYQQYYLREYAAYKLMNVVTPFSLNARLAEIEYVDSDRNKSVITRYGFLIEDTDDAAKRNGFVEVDIPDINPEQLSPVHAARYAMFQYMIGNLDWSMHAGPDGKDCCHNTKLVGPVDAAAGDLIPIAYDFDYSGFVDTPYAVPPDNVKVKTVRTRRYRGFCRHNEFAIAAAADFRGNQERFMSVIEAVEGLDDRSKSRTTRFLSAFFEHIATDETVDGKLLRTCRK